MPMISKLGKFTLMKGSEYRQKQKYCNVMDKAQTGNRYGWHAHKQEIKCSFYTINALVIFNNLILPYP